jgi:hypothetical protein
VPLAVKFASIGLNTALGAPVAHIAEFSAWYSLPMAIAINIVNPLNAQLPEEASFRGWAQPKLQSTRTPLAATAAYGTPADAREARWQLSNPPCERSQGRR